MTINKNEIRTTLPTEEPTHNPTIPPTQKPTEAPTAPVDENSVTFTNEIFKIT